MFQKHTGVTSPVFLQFLAGTTSGFATAVFAVPADFIKTNMQNQQVTSRTSAIGLVKNTIQESGVLGLWRGFLPFFLKLAPHTTISFMVIENLKKVFAE
jgi:solute carrier family 25 oxoglutarate transporter 11